MFHPEGGDNAGQRTQAGPEEETRVAHLCLKPSGGHTGQHHPQGHESRTDGIIGRAALPLGNDVDEEKRVGRKAEAVTQLFDSHAGGDDA